MQLRLLLGTVLVACPAFALAEAVSEWKTPRGLPVAIVEVPGGDFKRAAPRSAATCFLPAVPTAATLHVVAPEEVNRVLATLPQWEGLVRLVRGRAPQLLMALAENGGVRESCFRPSKG